MIDLRGTITYRDGQVAPVEAAQAEYAAWERYALRMGYPLAAPDVEHPGASVTMIRYLGYAAAHAGKPQGEWESFEAWDAGVVDVTLEPPPEAVGGEVPPTLREASGGSSQP